VIEKIDPVLAGGVDEASGAFKVISMDGRVAPEHVA
jgi:hypothetical protein